MRERSKRVKSEKLRQQLVKKLFPKSQNVTKTTFTVKKIVALEQLKKVDENEPVSNWNVPLKDLLSQLHHYNFTSRLKGLTGMKELIKKYPEVLKGSSLKSIIERVVELITDIEHKVRAAAMNLLTNIFELIPPNSIIPFSDILIVHLACAMTHRSVLIQEDSLKFIDLLLKYLPEAMKNNFKTIMQNFVRILKNYFIECHSAVYFTRASKKDIGKVKSETLLRFYKFLAAAAFHEDWTTREFSNLKCHEVNVLDKKIVNLRGADDQYKQIPNLSLLSKVLTNKERTVTEDVSEEFQSLCSVVIPMLLMIWKGISPDSADSESLVSEDVKALLSPLLGIFLIFYERAVALKDAKVERWFVSNYGKGFKEAFLTNFPYVSATTKRLRSSPRIKAVKEKCNDFLLENLIVCFLSYSLNIVKSSSEIESRVEKYLNNVLQMDYQTEIEMLFKVIEAVANASKYTKSDIFLSKILSTRNTTLQRGISKAFSQIILKEEDLSHLQNHTIMEWIQSLPDRLCEPQIFVEEIQTLLTVINTPTGNLILKKVEENWKEIITNLPKVKIEGISQLEGQKQIVNILYRCDKQVLEELLKDTDFNSLYPLELKNYILNIFYQKLKIRPK